MLTEMSFRLLDFGPRNVNLLKLAWQKNCQTQCKISKITALFLLGIAHDMPWGRSYKHEVSDEPFEEKDRDYGGDNPSYDYTPFQSLLRHVGHVGEVNRQPPTGDNTHRQRQYLARSRQSPPCGRDGGHNEEVYKHWDCYNSHYNHGDIHSLVNNFVKRKQGSPGHNYRLQIGPYIRI